MNSSPIRPPQIVYLDQNKWIDLARWATYASEYPKEQSILKALCEQVDTGRLVLPLTFTNLYETQKINDPERRKNLAFVQCRLSQGRVIRGRHRRLEMEIKRFLASRCGLQPPLAQDDWFLSDVFFEAVADWGDPRLGIELPEAFVAFIRSEPAATLFDYLTETPEDARTASVKKFTDGSERLRLLIEERRRKHAGESLSMRRRIYSVILMIDEFERIIGFANELGLPWQEVRDIGSGTARRLMSDVPTYSIEREIAVRLEAQSRPIHGNDFRDMASFCAVIPYCDLVIGERQFVNLARQAGLDKTTRLATDIGVLDEVFSQPENWLPSGTTQRSDA